MTAYSKDDVVLALKTVQETVLPIAAGKELSNEEIDVVRDFLGKYQTIRKTAEENPEHIPADLVKQCHDIVEPYEGKKQQKTGMRLFQKEVPFTEADLINLFKNLVYSHAPQQKPQIGK